MTGLVLIDTNLLLLLIVGSTDRNYIRMHKKLKDYREEDFEILAQIISLYDGIILVPHVLAEVSSLSRQIKDPAKRQIQRKFRELIEMTLEVPTLSRQGATRDEFYELGLTDSVILLVCALGQNDLRISLLTADQALAVRAETLGYKVENFSHWR